LAWLRRQREFWFVSRVIFAPKDVIIRLCLGIAIGLHTDRAFAGIFFENGCDFALEPAIDRAALCGEILFGASVALRSRGACGAGIREDGSCLRPTAERTSGIGVTAVRGEAKGQKQQGQS
jgi:hypothetical protein